MKNQIPAQQQGGKLDTYAFKECTSMEEAAAFYELAKHRLLLVSEWSKICEVPLSTFTLTDKQGNKLYREAEAGDLIKINIPGPGPQAGDGFDWVEIEKITEEYIEDTATLSMQARPVPSPLNTDENTAHFFSSAATSTFQVKRLGMVISAQEHGRNEVPNTDTSHLADNIRNTLVGWTAKIGLSFPQWKSLVKGIVADSGQHGV